MMPGRINAAGGGIEFDAGAPTVSMFGVLIVGLAVAAWVGGASAQELDCDNAMAQQDMNRCAGLGYEAADKALNAVWKKAKQAARNLDAEQSDDLQGAEAALVAAQRGWIAYRDGQCQLAGFEARGGSMEPLLVSSCLAELTRARTRELQEFAGGPAD